MGTQMKRIEDNQPFSQLKRQRSSLPATIDENSKKLPGRMSLGYGGRMPPSTSEVRSWDMRSLKVLVERTKFNEMQTVDSGRPIKAPLKPPRLTNGRAWKKATQEPVARLFRARRCYVKLPKDKALLRLLAGGAQRSPATPVEQKRHRGRPKKIQKVDTSALSDASPAEAGPEGLKRKTTDVAEHTPTKRRRKPKAPRHHEFYINIGSLTRNTSPRRKNAHSTSPEEVKRKPRRASKYQAGQLSLNALRDKFGIRFFKSYVKVKRLRDAGPLKKKRNGKNLSVSFLETVEIFGESSDGEEWMDFEDNCSKGARLKRLENGLDEDATPLSTSTPGRSGSPPNSGRRSSGGILKRKEKISFSPLKEDDNSPRKEQLKRANEKIVRLSFENQPAEDDERDAASTQKPETTGEETTAATPIAAEDDEDEWDSKKGEESVTIEAKTSSTSINPETELNTPPPVTEDDEATALEDEPRIENPKEKEESLKAEQVEDDKHKDHDDDNDVVPPAGKEGSFESAPAASPIPDEIGDQEHSAKKDEDNQLGKVFLNELESRGDEGDGEFPKLAITEDTTDSRLEAPEPTETDAATTICEDKEISDTSQVNTSTNSDQQFEDASELVATAILNDSAASEENESEAVLNAACQIATDEAAALLSDEETFPPTDGVEGTTEEDFTSVLTHPEVERSLQSAASDLVPDSQEIAVAEAASSQAAARSVAGIDVANEEDAFASVVAEVQRFTKDVNPEIYSDDVGITGTDVMMDNVQASNSLDDIFDDDVDDDIISSLRMSSSGNIDICHEKSLPIQVIETEVMAIPNDPDIIFGKSIGTTSSILDTSMNSPTDTLAAGHGQHSTMDTNSKISLGRIFQSVKSYMMPPTKDKNTALKD